MNDAAELLAAGDRLASALQARGLMLVTAESCTGGLVAATLTELAGSSDWFYGAFVTYAVDAKRRFVGVESKTLARWGAVSEPTAKEMALGALTHSAADVAVAITGVAGPTGGDVADPNGTVWFAWAARDAELVHSARHRFPGERREVRAAAACTAIEGVIALVQNWD